MLQFDAATTRLLEDAYQGSDVVRRRMASLEALAPRPGDTVVDIGSGPGLLTLELARAVGPQGRAIGVEPSAEMRAASTRRCADRDNVEIVDGTAEALPLAAGSVDGAVALQVFEYLPDIAAALREIARVLRPGARLVVGDTHWDTLVWFSDDRQRMSRMMTAWDGHLVEKRVPEILPALCRDAGFIVDEVRPLVFSDTVLKPDGLAAMMMHLMRRYAVDNGQLTQAAANAWFEEQHALSRDGRFFFAVVYFITLARKV